MGEKKKTKSNGSKAKGGNGSKSGMGAIGFILGIISLVIALGVALWLRQKPDPLDDDVIETDVQSPNIDLNEIDVESSKGKSVPVKAGALDEPNQKKPEPDAKPKWWESKWWEKVASKTESDRFKSKQILIVNTANFNATVTGPLKEKPLLIAFYDARSQSFKELQKHLEAAAEALGNMTHPPGKLGACDVTIHSYLGVRFAPQMRSAWQDKENLTSFKFGRPNYYPMIIQLFYNGSVVQEYTGVVNKNHMIPYLMRAEQPKSVNLSNASAVSTFLFKTRVGPLILGCGLKNDTQNTSEEFEAFNQTAYTLQTKAVFARASLADCRKGLKVKGTQYKEIIDEISKNDTARVIFARKGGNAMSLLKNHSQLRDNSTFGFLRWAWYAIPELLEEMTPDNSHVFLARGMPLVIFLLHAKVNDERTRAEALTQGLTTKVKDDLRFVWSDCKLYASQFQAEKECPVMLIVNTHTMHWEKVTMTDVETPNPKSIEGKRWLSGNLSTASASERFDDWLRNTSGSWFKGLWDEKNDTNASATANDTSNATTENATINVSNESNMTEEENLTKQWNETLKWAREGSWVEYDSKNRTPWRAAKVEKVDKENRTFTLDAYVTDTRMVRIEKVPFGSVRAVTEDFVDPETARRTYLDIPMPSENDTINSLWSTYMNLLYHMYDLKHSVQRRFPEHVFNRFNWSELDSNANDPRLKPFARSDEELRTLCSDEKLHAKLRKAIEARAAQRQKVAVVDKDIEMLEHLEKEKKKKAEAAALSGEPMEDLPPPPQVDKEQMRKGKNFKKKVYQKQKKLIELHWQLYDWLHDLDKIGDLITPPKPKQVDRRHVDDLSVSEFTEKYGKPGLPVLITGLNITNGEPWTLEYFKKRCGDKNVTLRKRNEKSKNWGGLVSAPDVLNLTEFIDTFSTNETRRDWYLHDWTLPGQCPQAFGEAPYTDFSMPRYFAGDYFQRAAFHGYQHSWPSLFVGSGATESKMHIDSGGTNFWLYLLSGKKEWKFYSRHDIVNVYSHGLGEAFDINPLKEPEADKPLRKYAQLYETIQEPGDLVFIPGGNPHAVRNLEDIHGISMNYVDVSNIWIHLDMNLRRENWRSFEVYTDGIFPHGLRSDQKDLNFGEWKSVPWYQLEYDIV